MQKREVSRSNPCPICGKPDWCCNIMKTDGSGYEIVCMREKYQGNIAGSDGKNYAFVRVSGLGNLVFEEYEQYIATYLKFRKSDLGFRKAQTEAVQLTIIDDIKPKCNKELNAIYGFMLEHLSLDEYHWSHLKQGGWSRELIKYHKVASFPEDDYLRTAYRNRTGSQNPFRRTLATKVLDEFGPDSLKGVPGAYMKDGYWTFYGYSGILFPMYDVEGNIKRLRLRKDFLDVKFPLCTDEIGYYYVNNSAKYHIDMRGYYVGDKESKAYIDSGGKYRTIASFKKNKEAEKQGFYQNELLYGCASANEYSLYTHPGDDYSIVILTEGEPKGAFINDKMHYPTLTASGVTSYLGLIDKAILKWAREKDIKLFVIASDADKKEPKKKNVLDCEVNLIKALKELHIPVGLAEWEATNGKGLDDCLANGHWPSIFLAE